MPYVGRQPNWPVAAGGFAKTVDGIPIFPRGQLPASPYEVLGYAQTGNPRRIAYLSKLAHADAAVVVSAAVNVDGFSTVSGGDGSLNNGGWTAQGWARTVVNRNITLRAWLIKYRLP